MAKNSLGHGGVRCASDCTCQRHYLSGCPEGCQCGKHSLKNSGQFQSGHAGRLLGGGAKTGWKGTADERFDSKVIPEPMSGCHLWLGAVDGTGYGSFKVDGKVLTAHAYADNRARGPLPHGLTRDHLCATRLCVNEDHIERVTRAENTRRELVRLGRVQQ